MSKLNGKVSIGQQLTLDDAITILRKANTMLLEMINQLQEKTPKKYFIYRNFANKMEELLKEFEAIQKNGDEAIAYMTPEFRLCFMKSAPVFFRMLGWEDRLDKDGNVKHDA